LSAKQIKVDPILYKLWWFDMKNALRYDWKRIFQ